MTNSDDTEKVTSQSRKTITELLVRLESIETRLAALVSNQEAKDHQWPRAVARGVSLFETSWPIRFFLSFGSVLALVAFGISLYALNQERQVRAEERASRQNESEFRRRAQIASSWQTLLLPVGGNVGKAEAFETIAASRDRLTGVDLSCENIGHFENGVCKNPAILDFDNGLFEETDWLSLSMVGVSFDETHVLGLRIKHGWFSENSYKDTSAWGWHLRDVSGGWDTRPFSELRCAECSFTQMELDWREIRKFTYANFALSRIIFPEDAEVDLSGRQINITTGGENIFVIEDGPPFVESIDLEAPPLFIKASLPKADDDEIELIDGPAIENIFWELYETFEFCALEATVQEQGLLPRDGKRVVSRYDTDVHCGFDLKSQGVREALMQGLRRYFMNHSFEAPDNKFTVFECRDGMALMSEAGWPMYWDDELDRYMPSMEEDIEFGFIPSGDPCLAESGFGN